MGKHEHFNCILARTGGGSRWWFWRSSKSNVRASQNTAAAIGGSKVGKLVADIGSKKWTCTKN